MAPSSAQSWTRRIRTGYYDNMRVSDAERSEVADLLGRHYSDGRLDKQEFDERVSRAMSAKTRADLDGLFDDLPDTGAPADDSGRDARRSGGPGGFGGPGGYGVPDGPARGYRVRRHHGGRPHPVLFVAAAVILASIAWHGLHAFFFVPWFAIVILILAVVYANRRARRLLLVRGDGHRFSRPPG
jgi:hypothetical protein